MFMAVLELIDGGEQIPTRLMFRSMMNYLTLNPLLKVMEEKKLVYVHYKFNHKKYHITSLGHETVMNWKAVLRAVGWPGKRGKFLR